VKEYIFVEECTDKYYVTRKYFKYYRPTARA